VVDGFDVLDNLTAEDGIVSAKVLEGAQNLQEHG
jgi:peptidylprolyl isomerase